MMALHEIVELTLPNGLVVNTRELTIRHQPWVQATIAREIAQRLADALNPEAFSTLCEWARTVPHFKPGQENVIIAFSLVALASAQEKLPTALLDEIDLDPLCAYDLFFKLS